MMLEGKNSGNPEIIFQLPPGAEVLKQSHMEVI
jgi:hypothetical protein